MSEKKIKHLEFIQNTINRMSTNSFIIKGWSITLISALFALAEKETYKNYVLLAYYAIPTFWYLNGYFLLQERKYRALYDLVRIKAKADIDFSMDISNFNTGRNTILCSLFASSIWTFYVFMIVITSLVMFLF